MCPPVPSLDSCRHQLNDEQFDEKQEDFRSESLSEKSTFLFRHASDGRKKHGGDIEEQLMLLR